MRNLATMPELVILTRLTIRPEPKTIDSMNVGKSSQLGKHGFG